MTHLFCQDSNEANCIPMFSTYPPPSKPYLICDLAVKSSIQSKFLGKISDCRRQACIL